MQNQVEEFQLDRLKLTEERSRYTQVKTAFESELDTLRAATLSNDAETTRQIIESMKPKQAKEQIVLMMDAGSMKAVVALISAMVPAKRARVLAEFKTLEENERLAENPDVDTHWRARTDIDRRREESTATGARQRALIAGPGKDEAWRHSTWTA